MVSVLFKTLLFNQSIIFPYHMHKDALLNTKFPIFMSNLIYTILFETISYLYLKLITILIKIFLCLFA